MWIQFLRDTSYVFLEEPVILTTIEDLLWQAGQRDLLQNLLNIEKLAPQSLPPELWGFFPYYSRLLKITGFLLIDKFGPLFETQNNG
jgi:hypothetical protein